MSNILTCRAASLSKKSSLIIITADVLYENENKVYSQEKILLYEFYPIPVVILNIWRKHTTNSKYQSPSIPKSLLSTYSLQRRSDEFHFLLAILCRPRREDGGLRRLFIQRGIFQFCFILWLEISDASSLLRQRLITGNGVSRSAIDQLDFTYCHAE